LPEDRKLYILKDRRNCCLQERCYTGGNGEQVVPDYLHDPKEWWEVMDRTAGQPVPVGGWELGPERHQVCVRKAQPFHEYTVSFLVYVIWDLTQMYNHITNSCGGQAPRDSF
jgi:1,3-beta-galactosyl-N-acetylhexosamine phosphorylase